MNDLNERLDELKRLIQSQEFLEGKGLSNEVNIRIFFYEPDKEMTVRHFTEKLVSDSKLACHLKEYNLYKVFLSICDAKRTTPRIPQQEEKKGTRIRTDYIHEQQSRYRTVIESLEQRIAAAGSSSEKVKLTKLLNTRQAQAKEIREYEEKVHHLADQMIKIDLDDGVKRNYAIFKDVLATIR